MKSPRPTEGKDAGYDRAIRSHTIGLREHAANVQTFISSLCSIRKKSRRTFRHGRPSIVHQAQGGRGGMCGARIGILSALAACVYHPAVGTTSCLCFNSLRSSRIVAGRNWPVSEAIADVLGEIAALSKAVLNAATVVAGGTPSNSYRLPLATNQTERILLSGSYSVLRRCGWHGGSSIKRRQRSERLPRSLLGIWRVPFTSMPQIQNRMEILRGAYNRLMGLRMTKGRATVLAVKLLAMVFDIGRRR